MSDGTRVCGVADQMGAEQVCAFPRPHGGGIVTLGWYMTGLLPGWAEANQKAAIAEAFSYWTDVCGLEAVHYESSSEALGDLTGNRIDGLIAVNVASLDGPSGVLADSYLPCGTIRIRQRYDAGESWVDAERPMGGKIDLVRVAAHELGHAIGIPHIGGGNLLQPTYSLSIRKPQNGDIAEAVKRYGPRRAPAPPPDKPTKPAGGNDVFGDLLKKLFGGGTGLLGDLLLKMLKDQLQKWIDDGTLAKFLEDMLNRLLSGKIKNVEQLTTAADESAKQNLTV